MTDYKAVNEWTAEACGTTVGKNPYDDSGGLYTANHPFLWTIEDARCREIFCNWWLAQAEGRTVILYNNEAEYFENYGDDIVANGANETDCIVAMHQSQTEGEG